MFSILLEHEASHHFVGVGVRIVSLRRSHLSGRMNDEERINI